jgi:hypothetical protein
VLALPDLEHAKTAVLNSLTSISGQRTYEHAIREFVAWYCSEPRLAFNRTVVLRYRIHLEQRQYAPATINLRLAAVRRIAYEAADAGLLSPELAAGISRLLRSIPTVSEGSSISTERATRRLPHMIRRCRIQQRCRARSGRHRRPTAARSKRSRNDAICTSSFPKLNGINSSPRILTVRRADR